MSRLSALLLCSLLPIAAGAADAMPPMAPATVRDADYPGTLMLAVDASDVSRRIQHVRERIPVQAGALTLWYPQWIPGNHAPTGPINQIAGLRIAAHGNRLAWRRDSLDMYAFHVEVPDGTEALDIEFDYLSPTSSAQGRVAMTPELLAVQWHRVLLYPAGYDARRIRVAASLTVPAGWDYASALSRESRTADTLRFAPVPLVELVDSPVYAGRHIRHIALDVDARAPVSLHAFADTPALLDAKSEFVAAHRALVVEADRVFGPRPFAHYDFLLVLSDTFGHIGLEHLQSSEDGTYPDYLGGDAPFFDNDLLPHEYVHAWNGKFRRPAASWAPHYNTPARNDLLWVYEGLTQYWAMVLTARSGLWTPEQAREVLAASAAGYAARRGRDWRNLQDTVHQGIVDYNDAPQAAESWQRAYDFYGEGALLWLAVDARLRELSHGRRTLDDFARRFYRSAGGAQDVSTYAFDDVTGTLETLQPGDWTAFLRQRLDGLGDDAPLDGLARAGWRVAFSATPNTALTAAEAAQEQDDFGFSLGLKIGHDGTVGDVLWDGPAQRAGIARDMSVIAVDGLAYTAARLREAVRAPRDRDAPIELLVRQADHYRTLRVDYHGGLRYPHLERVPGTPDRLGTILAARR